jgi:hypothetical protein
MTDTMTSQNIDLSSWDTLYITRQDVIQADFNQPWCLPPHLHLCYINGNNKPYTQTRLTTRIFNFTWL